MIFTPAKFKWQHLFITLLLMEPVACGQHQPPASTPLAQKKTANDSPVISHSSNRYKNIREIISTQNPSVWQHGKLDESARFHFGNSAGTLSIEYYPECWGSYPVKVK